MAAVTSLVIGYAALSQYSASSPDAKGLGAVLSIAPVMLIGLVLLWRWTQLATALIVAAVLCALLYRYWSAIERNYQWADLTQQCGLYGIVALSFGRSLLGGRIPLCTQLAGTMYGALTPAEISYTRRATLAWMLFYGMLTLAIAILFFSASMRVWSLFVNFATFALMMLMGVADHAIRRRVLPRHPRSGIIALMQRTLTG
ncbi:MAG TPA: hypothetical protein VGI32_02985 [Steroidobacteraceae bacterium]